MWSPETHSDTERFESLNQETVLGDFIAVSTTLVRAATRFPSSEEKTSPSGSNCVTPGPIVLTLSSKAYQVIDSSLPWAAKVSLVGKFGHIKLGKELFPAKFWKVAVQSRLLAMPNPKDQLRSNARRNSSRGICAWVQMARSVELFRLV